MEREVKRLSNYIDNLNVSNDNVRDIITVEHRQNNAKRDYLFVNKLQCKHIPVSPSKMLNMCKDLADKVNANLDSNSKVLVVGFAETATAIGHAVANFLNDESEVCTMSMHTTREDNFVNGYNLVVTFEEEHSHATTQKFATYKDSEKAVNIRDYNYVLFVEDEISTGNTIMNFVKALKEKGINQKYGVASICNWQSDEYIEKFKKENIDTFYLIGGDLKEVTCKMNIEDKDIITEEKTIDLTSITDSKRLDYRAVKDVVVVLNKNANEFESERLGRKPNISKDIKELADFLDELGIYGKYNTIRVIGTEEFMYKPIILGRILEECYNVYTDNVICHSTTRSSIDVLDSDFDDYTSGIKNKVKLRSAYDTERDTYLYNLDNHTDLTIVMTDSNNEEAFDMFRAEILNYLDSSKTDKIIFIRCR